MNASDSRLSLIHSRLTKAMMGFLSKRIFRPTRSKIISILSIDIEILTKVPQTKEKLPWARSLKIWKIRHKIMVKVRIEIVSRLSSYQT